MKEKAQPNTPAVASESAADVQYSVATGNKFEGVAEASDDPFEMLEKLTIEAKAPKDKKAEKPAQKDKKKPASAPQKPATANDKPAKKEEKPANANTPKAQEGGKPENKPEGAARAARGRGGRVGGPFAGGAGVADEQPPASAPVHREPPPPPKYDQPRPEGAGAPRGRGGRGFGFGGRGRGFPRGGGPRLAFAEGADVNAASGAAPGAQEGGATGGGDDGFVNRGFDAGARNPRGGFRGGGRGGFRGFRGGRGFGRPVADFGAPEVPGGPPVARKREFERHSGSDVTGVRPVEKREGAGAHNWGTVQDDLAGQTAALNESEIAEEGAPTTAPATGDQAAPAEGAEAPKDGEGEKSAEDAAKAEDEKKELTLEEYKAQMQQKMIPKTNFNVRPPEGADLKGLKQVVKKKEDQTEYVEEENTGDADADANKKGAKVAKQPKAAPVKDVGFRYENPQADFGPRGRRGGRGFRGGAGGEGGGYREGGAGFREGGAGFREGGSGFRGRGRGRFGEGGAAPPRLEDEDAFPALNPLGPH